LSKGDVEMKKTNKQKAFTIVELIIVIAVIGILAAILIPAFTNIIAKANAKSALSDARNTLTSFLTENLEIVDGEIAKSIVIFVKKAKMYYVFGYQNNGPDAGKLMQSAGNPFNYEDLAELIDDYNCPDYDIIGTEEETNYAFFLWPHDQPSGSGSGIKSGGMEEINQSFINLTERIKGAPETAQVFDGFLIGMIVDAGVHNPGGGGTTPGDDNPSGPTIVPTEEPEPTEEPVSIDISVKFYDTWNEELFETKTLTVDETGTQTITKEMVQSIASAEFTIATDEVIVDVQEDSNIEITFDGTRDRTIEGELFRVITNATGLKKIDSQVDVNGVTSMGAKYILNNNITSGMADWKPLGWVRTDDNGNPISTGNVQFSGTFDGGNFQISGLSMSWNNNNTNSYVGLFARTNSSAVIRNLIVLLTDTISGYSYVGTIVGQHVGTISNVHVTNGAPGQNFGVVQSTCSSSGLASASGGLVGHNYGGRIEKSSSCIYSVNSYGYCGGISGTNASGSAIDQCWSNSGANNTGNYALTAQRAGGIVGQTGGATDVSVSNCIAKPLYPICGNQYVGSLVGNAHNTAITNCYVVENGMVTPSGDNPTNIGAAIGGQGSTAPTVTGCYAVSSRSDSFFTVFANESQLIEQSPSFGWDTNIWIIDGSSLPRLRNNPFPA
jgi:prepilin-type N-terminal cleavage/methylation domain-containing protein